MKNVINRVKAPTPKFFRVLKTVGLVLLGISGSVIAAPVALPAVVVSVAGYMAVAGGVLSAVSQMTVDTSVIDKQDEIPSPSTSLRVTAQDDKEEKILKQVQDKNSGRDPEMNSG